MFSQKIVIIYVSIRITIFICIQVMFTPVKNNWRKIISISEVLGKFRKVLHCACAIKIPIATGRVNIRIHRDIEGTMWFGVG